MDYEIVKNNYRLTAVDFSKQKDLDVDPKVIHQIEFAGKLKNIDGVNVNGTQSMFALMI